MKRLTRDVAIATLAQNEVDRLDHGDLINVLIEGCAGWNSKIDEELVEAYAEYMDEKLEIVPEKE